MVLYLKKIQNKMSQGTNWKWVKMTVKGSIIDYTDKYRIYRDGRVESMKRAGRAGTQQLFLSVSSDNKVNLRSNKHRNSFSLHRLIAYHFIPNPDSFKYVMHVNNDLSDHSIDNLMWVKTLPRKPKTEKDVINNIILKLSKLELGELEIISIENILSKKK